MSTDSTSSENEKIPETFATSEPEVTQEDVDVPPTSSESDLSSGNAPASEGDREQQLVLPIFDAPLTPRQERVLHYLERRKMRNGQITKRTPLPPSPALSTQEDEEGNAITQTVPTLPTLPTASPATKTRSKKHNRHPASPLPPEPVKDDQKTLTIEPKTPLPQNSEEDEKTVTVAPITPLLQNNEDDEKTVTVEPMTPMPKMADEHDEQPTIQELPITPLPESFQLQDDETVEQTATSTPHASGADNVGVTQEPPTQSLAPSVEEFLVAVQSDLPNLPDQKSDRTELARRETLTLPTVEPSMFTRISRKLPAIMLPHSTNQPQVPRSQAAWQRRKMVRYISRKYMRRSRAKDHRAQRRFWTGITTTLFSLALLVLLIGGSAGYTAYIFITQTQTKYDHQVATLTDLLPLDNLKIYDSKGILLTELVDNGIHTTVKLDQIAPIFQNATIATEDRNFWTNQGVDLVRILKSAIDNLQHGHVVEGGSTITQQLIKNLIVGNETTFVRKLEEIVLTPKINTQYSKAKILEMYLNSIYYGNQAYGIDAAASIYFGFSDSPEKRASSQLDLAQSAMIAGIPSNPSAYDPLQHPHAAFLRFQNVLGFMVDAHFI
ncbi:MAG: transglycosylase domain-containing protein, partial [Chloroflexota bacterium]|nr:transglycosylase domain-containing protein [Chloroflexota bacterium]